MQDKLTLLWTSVAAAALIVLAVALALTTIASQETHAAAAMSAHSWLTDAFPTAQAGFARTVDAGR